MFILLVMTIAAIVTLSLNKTRLVRTLMDGAVTMFCYLGVIIFIALTYSRAIRSNSNKRKFKVGKI